MLIVTLIVSLATLLVVNLTYSTYLGSRTSAMIADRLQAEYVLKSVINLAKLLLEQDTSEDDGPQDTWGGFSTGVPIPAELLGIYKPGYVIEVEIRPEDAKVPIKLLYTGDQVNVVWRDILTRLFQNLGFDNDGELDHTGLFPQTDFNSEQLIGALIDYLDKDDDSYSEDGYEGIESQLPEGYFPNGDVKILGDLSRIPGFTPDRMRRLTPFVTIWGTGKMNINFIPRVLLKSLHEDITEDQVDQIVAFRAGVEGPFSQTDKLNYPQKLSDDILPDIWSDIDSIVGVQSNFFQVLGKVDFSASTMFARAIIRQSNSSRGAVIASFELF